MSVRGVIMSGLQSRGAHDNDALERPVEADSLLTLSGLDVEDVTPRPQLDGPLVVDVRGRRDMSQTTLNRLVSQKLARDRAARLEWVEADRKARKERHEEQWKRSAQAGRSGPYEPLATRDADMTAAELRDEERRWERYARELGSERRTTQRAGASHIRMDASETRAVELERMRRLDRGAEVARAALTRRMAMGAHTPHGQGMPSSGLLVNVGNDGGEREEDGIGALWSGLKSLLGQGRRSHEPIWSLHTGMGVDVVVETLLTLPRFGPEQVTDAFERLRELAASEAQQWARREQAPVFRHVRVMRAAIRVGCDDQVRGHMGVARTLCGLICTACDGYDAAALSRKQACIEVGGLSQIIVALHARLSGSLIDVDRHAEADERRTPGLARGEDAGEAVAMLELTEIGSGAREDEQPRHPGRALQSTPPERGSEERLMLEDVSLAACEALSTVVAGHDPSAQQRKELAIDVHALETLLGLSRLHSTSPRLMEPVGRLVRVLWHHMQVFHCAYPSRGQRAPQAGPRHQRAVRKLGLATQQFDAICRWVETDRWHVRSPARAIAVLSALRVLLPLLLSLFASKVVCAARALRAHAIVTIVEREHPDDEQLLREIALLNSACRILYIKGIVRNLRQPIRVAVVDRQRRAAAVATRRMPLSPQHKGSQRSVLPRGSVATSDSPPRSRVGNAARSVSFATDDVRPPGAGGGQF